MSLEQIQTLLIKLKDLELKKSIQEHASHSQKISSFDQQSAEMNAGQENIPMNIQQ